MDEKRIEVRCARCGEIRDIFAGTGEDGKVYMKIGSDIWLRMRDGMYVLCEKCMKTLNIMKESR